MRHDGSHVGEGQAGHRFGYGGDGNWIPRG
jgi:hypothetical protein